MGNNSGNRHAATERLGVDVVSFPKSNLNQLVVGTEDKDELLRDCKHPSCEHGPTILFRRWVGNSGLKSTKFFACSAFRDRKDCPIYVKYDELDRYNRKRNEERNRFVEDKSGTKSKLLKQSTTTPTRILPALSFDKANAQYFFTDQSTNIIIDVLTNQLNSKNILCIGTPKLHEVIQNKRKVDGNFRSNSLLLDLDDRYQDYFPETFYKFNMCNGHLYGFSCKSKENEYKFQRLLEFFTVCDCIILDPPFGVLISVISHSLRTIWDCIGKVNTVWIFPMYFKKLIQQEMNTEFNMLHYKVNYTNHPRYHNRKNLKSSPVRLFINTDLKNIKLPLPEYKYCEKCYLYVDKASKHCDLCKDCTMAQGIPFKHCNICNKCVKQSKFHCSKCNLCLPKLHDCKKIAREIATTIGRCHVCGSDKHQRKDCNGNYSPKRQKVSSWPT